VPGCRYNIGQSKGSISIPINQIDLSEYLSEVRRCTYMVSEQLFDKLEAKIDISAFTIIGWVDWDAQDYETELNDKDGIIFLPHRQYSIVSQLVIN